MASMDVQGNLIYTYAWNFYTMRLMGIWPEERKWNRLSSYIVLMPILMMLCFICVPQSTNLVFIWGDLDLVVDNISVGNMTITLALLKMIVFWTKGKPLKYLLKCMAKDWSTVSDVKERETMRRIAEDSRTIVIRSNVLVNSVVLAYAALRFITRQNIRETLFFRAYFPYNTSVSPNFELTISGQIVGTFYAATTYTAVDTFVAMLILHVCGQLSNLREEIRSLKSSCKTDIQVKLRSIVRKHDYINEFAETIENCFHVMLLMQTLGCTVQVCFQCFQDVMFITGKEFDFQVFFLFSYTVYVMLQLFLYCYVGEKLLLESSEVVNAVYDCEWYNFPAKDAKLLIMIMCRAKLPLRITAGRFFSFSMELFSQILKTSVGYTSVLYAMNIE